MNCKVNDDTNKKVDENNNGQYIIFFVKIKFTAAAVPFDPN